MNNLAFMNKMNILPPPKNVGLAASALFGNKSEFKVESLEGNKERVHGAFSNGIWERRRTFIGDFVHLKSPMDISSLKVSCSKSFTLRMDKMPIGIYHAALKLFQHIAKTRNDEVMIQVFWNKTTREFVIDVPVQRVASAEISFDRNTGLMIDPNYIWCLDLHSHCNMGAFFSGGDNRDEASTLLFGVIGRVGSNPESKWRAGCNRSYVDLEMSDIFDMDSSKVYTIPDSSLSKITDLPRVNYMVGYGNGRAFNHGIVNNFQFANNYPSKSFNQNFSQNFNQKAIKQKDDEFDYWSDAYSKGLSFDLHGIDQGLKSEFDNAYEHITKLLSPCQEAVGIDILNNLEDFLVAIGDNKESEYIRGDDLISMFAEYLISLYGESDGDIPF